MERIISLFTLIVALLCCCESAQAQNGEAHLQAIAEEYCQAIKELPPVDTASWWIETLDQELSSFTISDAAEAAYLKAEGVELSEALATSDRLSLRLLGKVFEGCPTLASERMMLQQVTDGGYNDLLERAEWREVLDYIREDVISKAMAVEDEMLVRQVTQALKNGAHSEAFDTLGQLTVDVFPLLFTALSNTEPKVMGRYKLEVYDGTQMMEWIMTSSPDSISRLVGLDENYNQLCNRIDRVVDSLQLDLSEIAALMDNKQVFDVEKEAVDRLAKLYEVPVINRAVIASNASGILFMRLFQECGTFRDLIKEHAFEAAMEASEVVGEEKKMYHELMDDLCGCMQFSVQAESMECFETRMKEFGLSDESTSLENVASNPELQRKMTIFQTLMPAIGGGCAPKFTE